MRADLERHAARMRERNQKQVLPRKPNGSVDVGEHSKLLRAILRHQTPRPADLRASIIILRSAAASRCNRFMLRISAIRSTSSSSPIRQCARISFVILSSTSTLTPSTRWRRIGLSYSSLIDTPRPQATGAAALRAPRLNVHRHRNDICTPRGFLPQLATFGRRTWRRESQFRPDATEPSDL